MGLCVLKALFKQLLISTIEGLTIISRCAPIRALWSVIKSTDNEAFFETLHKKAVTFYRLISGINLANDNRFGAISTFISNGRGIT